MTSYQSQAIKDLVEELHLGNQTSFLSAFGSIPIQHGKEDLKYLVDESLLMSKDLASIGRYTDKQFSGFMTEIKNSPSYADMSSKALQVGNKTSTLDCLIQAALNGVSSSYWGLTKDSEGKAVGASASCTDGTLLNFDISVIITQPTKILCFGSYSKEGIPLIFYGEFKTLKTNETAISEYLASCSNILPDLRDMVFIDSVPTTPEVVPPTVEYPVLEAQDMVLEYGMCDKLLSEAAILLEVSVKTKELEDTNLTIALSSLKSTLQVIQERRGGSSEELVFLQEALTEHIECCVNVTESSSLVQACTENINRINERKVYLTEILPGESTLPAVPVYTLPEANSSALQKYDFMKEYLEDAVEKALTCSNLAKDKVKEGEEQGASNLAELQHTSVLGTACHEWCVSELLYLKELEDLRLASESLKFSQSKLATNLEWNKKAVSEEDRGLEFIQGIQKTLSDTKTRIIECVVGVRESSDLCKSEQEKLYAEYLVYKIKMEYLEALWQEEKDLELMPKITADFPETSTMIRSWVADFVEAKLQEYLNTANSLILEYENMSRWETVKNHKVLELTHTNLASFLRIRLANLAPVYRQLEDSLVGSSEAVVLSRKEVEEASTYLDKVQSTFNTTTINNTNAKARYEYYQTSS